MSQRTFGMEIECGHQAGRNHVQNLLRRGPHPRWARNMGIDGSGIEIRSPVLQGKEGFKEMHTVMNFLTSEGCFVSTRDGLHVHHGSPDFYRDYRAVERLVKSWKENQGQIDKFVAPYRQTVQLGRYPYNPGWDENMVRMVESAAKRGVFPRIHARPTLNIANMDRARNATIEVRQFGGCLDPEAAEAWITFCQRFIDSVSQRKRVLATCSSTEVLLRRVKTPKVAATKLLTSRPVDPPTLLEARRGF